MSLLNLSDPKANELGAAPLSFSPTNFFDVTQAAFDSTNIFRFKDNIDSRLGDEITSLNRRYRDATGRNLSEKLDMRLKSPISRDSGKVIGDYEELTDRQMELLDNEILSLRKANPGQYRDFETPSEIRERVTQQLEKEATATDKKFALALEGNRNLASRWGGVITGSLGAGLLDPENIVASFAFGGAAGRFVKSGQSAVANISRMMLVEGGINAAVEVAQHRTISKWHEDLGREYGLKDLATNVGIAFLGGAAISGTIAGAFRGISKKGFDGMVTRLEADAARVELSKMNNPEFLDFLQALSENPQGFTRQILDADLNPTTRALVMDTYRQIKSVDNLSVSPEKMELAETLTRQFMKNEAINDRDLLELVVASFDRAVQLPARKAKKVLKDLEKFFPDEVEAITDLKLDKVSTNLLRKIRGKKLSELSRTERSAASHLELIKKGEVDDNLVSLELARRKNLKNVTGKTEKVTSQSIEMDLLRAIKTKKAKKFAAAPVPKVTVKSFVSNKTGQVEDIFQMVDRMTQADVVNRNIDQMVGQYQAATDASAERAAESGIGFRTEMGEDIEALKKTDLAGAEIFIDGSQRKISEILEEFDQDERFLKAVKDCAAEAGGNA